MKRYVIWFVLFMFFSYGLGWVSAAGEYVPVWPGLVCVFIGFCLSSPWLSWARK